VHNIHTGDGGIYFNLGDHECSIEISINGGWRCCGNNETFGDWPDEHLIMFLFEKIIQPSKSVSS